MEGLFLADLASSVEIVFPARRAFPAGAGPLARVGAPRQTSLDPEDPLSERALALLRENPNLGGVRVAQLVRAGAQFGEALAGNRVLGPEDRAVLGTAATFLFVVTVALVLIPKVVAWSLAAVLAWIWLIITVRVMSARRRAKRERRSLQDAGGPARKDLND